MSLDRYLSVVYPLKAVRLRTKGSAWKAVIVAWTLASGFSIKVLGNKINEKVETFQADH